MARPVPHDRVGGHIAPTAPPSSNRQYANLPDSGIRRSGRDFRRGTGANPAKRSSKSISIEK
ncbi:hypothetical protein ACIQI8_15300 [Streptomyces sp. NPDC092369]|uniref:hypothetical protein n=1 Tax=Streptomyces sp. NPDC092369 TaxID=3366015 RepID=UPI003806F2EC